MEVLLDAPEEYLDVPPCLVELGDGSSREFHVVGEQDHRETMHGVVHGNPAYGLLIFPCRFIARQVHRLVYEDFRVRLVGQFALLNALVEQVLPYPYHKEHLHAVPKAHEACVGVSPVTYDDASRLHLDAACRGVVARLAVSNVHIFGEQRVEVQQRVQFHRPLGVGIVRPVVHRGTEGDESGVKGIGGVAETEPAAAEADLLSKIIQKGIVAVAEECAGAVLVLVGKV